MAVLADASIVISAERRGIPPDEAIGLFEAEEAFLASITASELLVGVYRADTPARRLRREAFVEAILRALEAIPFDLAVARVHARLSNQLRAAGQPIGAHDLLIAATAVAHGFAVLTDNVREFEHIPELVVRRPAW
jgi:tRNA(fMet)-specific endonuclease VapC